MGMAAAVIGAGALTAGASLYGTSQATKAAGKAADKNAQIQTQQYQQTRSDLSPFMQGGYAANSALMQRLGLASPTGGATTGGTPAANGNTTPAGLYLPGTMTPAGAQGFSTGDLAAIRKDWPGIEQEFNRARASADPNSPAFQQAGLSSLDDFTKAWYDNRRNPADYTYTPASQQPAATTGGDTPQGQQPATGYTDANNGGLGERPEWTRPEFTEAQPEIGQGPQSADYLQNFETSPGYQFRLDQGLRNTNAKYGARGLLKSGAAIQGLNDYAQGMASQEYGNWFNQQMQRLGADQGQFNNDRATGLAQYNQNRNVFNTNTNYDQARNDNIFESDRAYNTGRYDTMTGNLFQLAGMGANAASGAANAGANYASGMTANNNNLASVRGNAAIAGANGINSAINAGLNAYGMYSNPFSVSNVPTGGSTTGWLPGGFNGAF